MNTPIFGMKNILSAAIAALFPFILSGCLATSREIVELRDDINQLRLKLNELQANQADLGDKMSSLDLNISAFSERLEENKNAMSLVARRLDDMETNITSKVVKISDRMSAFPPESAPPAGPSAEMPPSELYRMAYDDFVAGRQESAASTFKVFLEKYPSVSLAPYAMYYLGESYYARAMWREALESFSDIVEKHPESERALSALYKKALSLEGLGETESAKKIYADIMKSHPASQEASSSSERLAELSETRRKK